MMYVIAIIIMFLIIGNLLAQIVLIQSTPGFKVVKKYPLIVIRLYYGFFVYLLFSKKNDFELKLRYVFLPNKFAMFVQYLCICLEKYLASHPQRKAVCREHMAARSTRRGIYMDAEQNLLYA